MTVHVEYDGVVVTVKVVEVEIVALEEEIHVEGDQITCTIYSIGSRDHMT